MFVKLSHKRIKLVSTRKVNYTILYLFRFAVSQFYVETEEEAATATCNGKWQMATGRAKSAKENGKLLHILYFMLEIFMISCNLWLTFGPESVRLGWSVSQSAPLTAPLAGKRLSFFRFLVLFGLASKS